MTPRIEHATLATCHEADGVVVVVDVLRAFTTAAHALHRGARDIVLVSTVEQAFELRTRDPACLLMGEVAGLPIDGFDLPNSPRALEGRDLRGRRLVHRTTSGTQGAVRARRAEHLLAASLCVASATAGRVRALAPEVVTFVDTGIRSDGGGEEDEACSEYIASLILGAPLDPTEVERRVRTSRAAGKFRDPEQPDFPDADLGLALAIDEFNFAMEVEHDRGLLVLKRIG